MTRRIATVAAFLFALLLIAAPLFAQTRTAERGQRPLVQFVDTPAVSGYEGQLGHEISSQIASLHPKTDNLGDVIVTIGTGAPHRLIVTPIDEPGFVVSDVTPDGYLRVQRLPQFGLSPI
ncbi:MAG TPA: hypothetical protein VFW94_05780, partial [Candidatus Acidoferrales bacterium]|nr:hypothetical protein [Candidatus Acidoferrales bacterium]